jgi:hypothetical protein
MSEPPLSRLPDGVKDHPVAGQRESAPGLAEAETVLRELAAVFGSLSQAS